MWKNKLADTAALTFTIYPYKNAQQGMSFNRIWTTIITLVIAGNNPNQ